MRNELIISGLLIFTAVLICGCLGGNVSIHQSVNWQQAGFSLLPPNPEVLNIRITAVNSGSSDANDVEDDIIFTYIIMLL